MSQTRLADCENKDTFTIESILLQLAYLDTDDLDENGNPKIKIRTA